MGAIPHEVVGPDMVRPLRSQPDAGSIAEPEPAPLRLPPRHLEPLAPPDALDPLLVHGPARLPQKGRDPAVAVVRHRRLVANSTMSAVSRASSSGALGRRRGVARGWPRTRHGPALRHAERLADPGHRLAARRGADQFRCADLRFPGSPASKDELVQREVGHRPAQARVLLLELLQTPHLLELQAAELASPAVAARRGLEPLAARASPSPTPTLRIASASDVPCATLTSTPPAAARPPLRACASSSAWCLLRGLSRHHR